MLTTATFTRAGKSDMVRVVGLAPTLPRKSFAAASAVNNRGEESQALPNLELVPMTFTSSQVWIAPQTTTRLEKLQGKGASGSPSGTYPDSTEYADTADVSAVNINGNGPFYPLSWDEIDADYTSYARGRINQGGSGSIPVGYMGYTGYTGDGTAYWNLGTVSWTDAIAGTATTQRGGWGSGTVIAGANGWARVRYTRKGQNYSATTGASATAFDSTFPGGYAGPASVTSVTDPAKLVVTPGRSYQINVPSGGEITIEFYQ